MLHEYAVEPELVATWSDRKTGRYFVDKFGIGSPRIISMYPRGWKRRVWRAWQERPENREGTPIVRQRMVELIANLSNAMTRRSDAYWDQELAWLENVSQEHQRIPFHAILARCNTAGHPSILVADEVDETVPLWNHDRSVAVSRTPKQIARAVGGMLRIATDIVFVDPYFAPHRPRWTGQNRPFMDTAKPAISGDPRRELSFTSPPPVFASSGPWFASSGART